MTNGKKQRKLRKETVYRPLTIEPHPNYQPPQPFIPSRDQELCRPPPSPPKVWDVARLAFIRHERHNMFNRAIPAVDQPNPPADANPVADPTPVADTIQVNLDVIEGALLDPTVDLQPVADKEADDDPVDYPNPVNLDLLPVAGDAEDDPNANPNPVSLDIESALADPTFDSLPFADANPYDDVRAVTVGMSNPDLVQEFDAMEMADSISGENLEGTVE